jgi:hypothetical protein
MKELTMRISIILPLALGLAGCGQAEGGKSAPGESNTSRRPGGLALDAAGVPRFQPGAWEYRQESGDGIEIVRTCLGEAGNTELREILTRRYPAECKVERSSGFNGLTFRASCRKAGLTTETQLDVSGSDTAIDMTLGLFVITQTGERSGDTMTNRLRRVGECPAGVREGQEIKM